MKNILIQNKNFEIENDSKIIGIITETETKDTFEFILKLKEKNNGRE